MPAVSRAQRIVMAIAEHNPSKLYKRNKGVLKMSHFQLHNYASTATRGLAEHIRSAATGKHKL